MLNSDFKEFIQLLNDNQVKYLVIGGYAVAVHGHPRYIDLITTPDGIDFDTCYTSKLEIIINDIPVQFIDLNNLKKNKKASGRLQDLSDLENLE